MAEQKKKIKLLYIMKILLEQTDEDHTLNGIDLVGILSSQYGIEAERKSIYKDIDLLIEYGLDIVQNKGSNPGYYIASREFEISELKLLVDAVQASKFISKRKSDILIEKLERLTSEHSAGELQRQVQTADRVKSENENVFYNIDDIHKAIQADVQISFDYYAWTPEGKFEKNKKKRYVVSPWCLVWADENYYLVSYDHEEKKTKHFRVDKMKNIEATEDRRNCQDKFKDFNIARFSKKTFGMFDGGDKKVSLICHNSLANPIFDTFGKVHSNKIDAEHFRVTVDVTVSPQFYGWVAGLGGGVVINGPQDVIDGYKEHLKTILNNY